MGWEIIRPATSGKNVLPQQSFLSIEMAVQDPGDFHQNFTNRVITWSGRECSLSLYKELTSGVSCIFVVSCAESDVKANHCGAVWDFLKLRLQTRGWEPIPSQYRTGGLAPGKLVEKVCRSVFTSAPLKLVHPREPERFLWIVLHAACRAKRQGLHWSKHHRKRHWQPTAILSLLVITAFSSLS